MSIAPPSSSQEESHLQWCQQLDVMLANWCDQAKCFEWMHNESYSKYNTTSQHFIVFITILSSLAGTSNIIVGGQTINGFQVSSFFGALSILASLGNVLQDKLGYAQSAQAHKIYCGTWGQIRRKIESELILPYGSRKDAASFLKMIRTDIDQVSSDGASKIPKIIREACAKNFDKIPSFDVPDICGQLEHTQIYIAPPLVIPQDQQYILPSPKSSKQLVYIPQQPQQPQQQQQQQQQQHIHYAS